MAVTEKAKPAGITVEKRHRSGDRHALTVLCVAAASGLCVDVLPDRCLDIGAVMYRGLPVAWMSDAPLRHPTDLPEPIWRHLFVGGLLATCGLDNVGPVCTDHGRDFAQHGRLAAEPAQSVRWGTRIVGGRRIHWLFGAVAQPDSALRLRRHILIADDHPTVRVSDFVRNTGVRAEPVMIQYHCNFGSPFRRAGRAIDVPGTTVVPRDAAAATALDHWQATDAPHAGEVERVFRHEQRGARQTLAHLVPPAESEAAAYAITVRADHRTLPSLWQWRLLGSE